MAKKRVAVETGLSDVREMLNQKGYEVVNLDPISASGTEFINCQAFVITGMDKNMGGFQDIHTKAPVIDASGLTPQDILNQIQNRIG
ncbi:MAG: YkuS family protein [Clostridia bacterium]|nr:YkuS family protein [Clostridia bacterium]